MKNVGIVLAAGRGKRMHTTVQKQYLLLCGKPVLYYSLKVFQDCPFIDELILVTGKDEIDYCQKEIVRKFNLDKVKKIVPGGKERYHSVYEGLKAAHLFQGYMIDLEPAVFPHIPAVPEHDHTVLAVRQYIKADVAQIDGKGLRIFGNKIVGTLTLLVPVTDNKGLFQKSSAAFLKQILLRRGKALPEFFYIHSLFSSFSMVNRRISICCSSI